MKTNNPNYTSITMYNYIKTNTKFFLDDVLTCISILTVEQQKTLFKNYKNIDLEITFKNKNISDKYFHKIMMSCAILMDLAEMKQRQNKNKS
jgi:hypothetical protein